MRKAGAKRVSDDAKEALAEVLEHEGLQIAKAAAKLAEHAKRQTITRKDIQLARSG